VLRLLHDVTIFKEVGCSTKFLEFLAQHLEERIFLQGQRIVDESAENDDRCMYFIGQGQCVVHIQGKKVAELRDGAVIGEIIALGLATKRNASVTAESTCFVYALHQRVVVQGLELFPEERERVMVMAMKHQQEGQKDSDWDVEPINSRRLMAEALRRSPVLANVSLEFIHELSSAATDRMYMPGDKIIEQGKKGDSMLIMVSGNASVYISDAEKGASAKDKDMNPDRVQAGSSKLCMTRVGSLVGGSVGGELCMLGVARHRSATIIAESICAMWEISQDDALIIMDRHLDAQEHFGKIIIDHLERTVPMRLLGIPLFKDFDTKIRTLLGIYCERKAFFRNQHIVREGTVGERLYIVNSGRARLERKGVTVKQYQAGCHFGCSIMLGIHKVYIGSVVSLETCHILVITRSVFQSALEQYPAHQAAQALKRSEKTNAEALREAVVRTSTRRLIRSRCSTLQQAHEHPRHGWADNVYRLQK
jgi:CRP-like cAMP-binding protein